MKIILDALLPNICVLCHLPAKHSIPICSGCLKDLPTWKNRCHCCGREMINNAQQLCGNCMTTKTPYTQTIVGYRYQFPVDHLITKLKFNDQLLHAKILGTLLTKKITKYYYHKKLPELILPVPLHPKRLRKRGFNQATEIAKPIARKLKIPIDYYSCIRAKNTEAQSSLPEKKRKDNIKNAFKIKKPINAKHIAIIDDVITTGSTITELSKLLRKNGVEQIDVWCVAKTKYDSSKK